MIVCLLSTVIPLTLLVPCTSSCPQTRALLTVCLIEMFQDGGEPEADEAASANAADPDNPDPQPTEPRSFTSTRHTRVPCPNSSPFQDSQTQM